MKALVLDFDGVVSDSAREAFAVAVGAYVDLRPQSPLAQPSRDLFDAFLELMPLGNRAEDYGTALAALEENQALADQEAYDRYRAAQDAEWLQQYHRRFYKVRTAMANEDPQGWRQLMQPYQPFLDVLRRRAGSVAYAIATSKDRAAVDVLLESYGVKDLFTPDLILDKEVGEKKVAHLQRLRDALDVDYSAMTFVDDKVNHLDSVAPLGVRCALAAWGYNSSREHQLAEARGYLLCTLQDVEQKLFDAEHRNG